MSSHLLQSMASAYVMFTWEDKPHNLEHVFFLLLSPSFYRSAQHCMVWNIPSVEENNKKRKRRHLVDTVQQ